MSTLAPDRPTTPPAGEAERPTTLLPVLRIIPEECYDNPTWRGLFAFGRDVVLYGLVAAGLVAFDQPWIVVPLWIASAFVISGLFIVGHDAAHESLFSSKRMNSVIGHLAMLPSWHVYEGWVLGHNRIHHGHTVRQSMDFVWHPLTPEQYASLSRVKRLRHRIEWSWLGSMPYYLRDVWWNKMIAFDPPAKWAARIRRDRLIILAFVGSASIALGLYGWTRYASVVGVLWIVAKVLVVPFLAFTFTIGWVVHVHHIDPNIRWYPRRDWDKFKGQMEGTTVLDAPRWLDFFLHKIFVHVPHHVDMRIPFYRLDAAASAIEEAFPGVVEHRKLRLQDFLGNTSSCKLYDFEAGHWLTYDEARPRIEAAVAASAAGAADADWSGTNSF